MTDTKYKDIQDFSIGYNAANKTTMTKIIRLSDKIVSPEGDLVEAFASIDDKQPSDVVHNHRYYLVELVLDGWDYEAFFTQQVEDGDSSSRAIRQGADNDPIGYLVGTLKKVGGTKTVTYESTRGMLSGFHLQVTNRKGTKYQPCTVRFKVRGNRT